MTTAAPRSSGRLGMISANARGPPVEAAIATTLVAASGDFLGTVSLRIAAASGVGFRTPPMFIARAASSADLSCSRTVDRSMLTGPDGFLTNSRAPRSSARRVISFPSSEPAALNITTGRGISAMICSSACKPFRRGISMSRVTISGLRARIFCNASTPSPAVPITQNGPLDSTISAISLRMNALSSTTNTVAAFSVISVTTIGLDLPEDAFARIHGRKEGPRFTEEAFDFSENEEPARSERAMECREECVLCRAFEVDDHVATEDEMGVLGPWLAGEEIVALEADQSPDLWKHRVRSGNLREILSAQRRRRVTESRVGIAGALCVRETLGIDVRANDLDVLEPRLFVSLGGVLVHQDANRIWLFTRRASRAPDARLPLTALPQRRNDFVLDHGIRVPVPEELRHVHGQRSNQAIVFVRIAVERRRVIAGRHGLFGTHAYGDAAAQALVLVAGASEPSIARDLLDQRLETRVVSIDPRRVSGQERPDACVAFRSVREMPSSAAERLRRSCGSSGASATPFSATSRALS